MKITKSDLKQFYDSITKLFFHLDDMSLVFPVDFKVKATDEFGIETTKFKAETSYGNKFVPVLAYIRGDGFTDAKLAYCSSVDLISFDLAEYFEMMPPIDEDIAKFLTQFECCLIFDEKLHKTFANLKVLAKKE